MCDIVGGTQGHEKQNHLINKKKFISFQKQFL